MIKINVWSDDQWIEYKQWVYNFIEYYQITEFDDDNLLVPLAAWRGVSVPKSPYIAFECEADCTLFLLRFS
jgi:hypothetical protein